LFFEAEFHRLSAFSQSLLTISLALLLAGLALLLPLLIHYYGLWFGWTSYTRWKLSARSKLKHA
jgi:hypothetical protein